MSGNVTKSFLDRQVGIISAKTFQRNVTCQNLQKIALSKFQTVKTVGRKGVQTSLDIDPLEWRYILSGTSDGLVAIYDTQNRSGIYVHSIFIHFCYFWIFVHFSIFVQFFLIFSIFPIFFPIFQTLQSSKSFTFLVILHFSQKFQFLHFRQKCPFFYFAKYFNL